MHPPRGAGGALVFLELFEEEGEELFFAGENGFAEEGGVVEAGEGNGGDEAGIACDEEDGVEGGEVGNHEGGEVEVLGGAAVFEALDEFFAAFEEVVRGTRFDLADGEGAAGGGVLFGVHGEHFVYGEVGELAGVVEYLVPVGFGVEVEEPGEVVGHDAVGVGGGGGAEDEGVGKDTREKEPGDGVGECNALVTVHLGDDGGGGADDAVDEGDGLFGGDVAEAVVVDDFEDAELVDAFDSEGDFVVVDHDDVDVGLLDEVAFAEHADDAFVGVDDG